MEIPFELFLGFVGIAVGLAIFGFIRQPQIPAMLAFGGIFIFMIAVLTTGVIMGKIPETSIDSGSTTTYTFIDNVYPFDSWSKTLFALVGGIMMLASGFMVNKS